MQLGWCQPGQLLPSLGRIGTTLVEDEPIVVHCYTTPLDIEDDRNLAMLGGRETRQGEIGLVVGDEYFAIHDFNEGAKR